jgi:hypothetical protein
MRDRGHLIQVQGFDDGGEIVGQGVEVAAAAGVAGTPVATTILSASVGGGLAREADANLEDLGQALNYAAGNGGGRAIRTIIVATAAVAASAGAASPS